MRRLSLTFLTAVAVLALGACDSNAPDASAVAPTADAVTCSAPSISSTTIGGRVHLTNYGSSAGFEVSPYQQNSWSSAGLPVSGISSNSTFNTFLPAYTGGTIQKTSYRARRICYDAASNDWVTSPFSSVITVVSNPPPLP